MYFFVYDNIVSVKPEQKKTFLLHMETEPSVSSDTVTVRNGGTLTSRTLLPENPVLTVLGGEGREFLIGGRQMEVKRQYPHAGSIELGWGRVEVSPADDAKECEFLHAMYTGEGALASARIDCGEAAVGASLPGCIAVFAKDAPLCEVSLTLTEESDVYVVGAAAGFWRIAACGTDHAARAAIAGEGLLKFRAPAGKITARRTAE